MFKRYIEKRPKPIFTELSYKWGDSEDEEFYEYALQICEHLYDHPEAMRRMLRILNALVEGDPEPYQKFFDGCAREAKSNPVTKLGV